MHVNSLIRAVRSSWIKLLATIAVGVCTIFVLAAFITGRSQGELISKRANIAVRAVGHELLLRAGDATSLVPPVIEKSKGVFLLEFENEFAFQPDTLVAVAQRILAKTGLTQYTVTVQRCLEPEIVYGFEINPPNNSIEACRGRVQPRACYNIEVAFANFPDKAVSNSRIALMVSGVLVVFAFVLISSNFRSKPKLLAEPSVQDGSDAVFTIGKFAFDVTHQVLRKDNETVSLTDKECRILALLNRNIGQLTLREDLIQEVWTDEGVITGRSLDMFISKLRKKLSADPGLRITNIHGKGYKLEVVNDSMA